jgi:hypothetical protein
MGLMRQAEDTYPHALNCIATQRIMFVNGRNAELYCVCDVTSSM